MSQAFDIIIVGAGHGGANAAVQLRQRGFEGSIAMIGDEPDLPYERPPLSKEYFAGEKEFERIQLRPAKYWDEREVTMLLGKRVASVEASRNSVKPKTLANTWFSHTHDGVPRKRWKCRANTRQASRGSTAWPESGPARRPSDSSAACDSFCVSQLNT